MKNLKIPATILLEIDILNKLEDLKAETGKSKSRIVNEVLRKYLEENG